MKESYFESISAVFDEKPPFLSILDTFGQFLGTFPIRPVLIIPWLLNWIIFWTELPEFILNWIIFWIESWVKQQWIEYWMNHFLAKFKHWIESYRVSNTPTLTLVKQCKQCKQYMYRAVLHPCPMVFFKRNIHDTWANHLPQYDILENGKISNLIKNWSW